MSLPDRIRQAIEEGLTAQSGAPVHLAAAEAIPFSRVFRCTLESTAESVPATLIVRLPRPGTAGERAGTAPLDRERAALRYLSAVDGTLTPRFYLGGAEAGFLVSEDLGKGPSLLDLLLGKDAPVAHRQACDFARRLGALHARTLGRAADTPGIPRIAYPVREHWQQVREATGQQGLPTPAATVEADVESIVRRLAAEEALALSSGDPSPVNCVVGGEGVRFFDFEASCFRHCLIDAALVLCFPYPTGGPAWTLPPTVASQMEFAYRQELGQAYPALTTEERFSEDIAAASAAWMIVRLARLPRVDAGPDREEWGLVPPHWSGPFPTRSRRRQLVAILETLVAVSDRAQTLEALTDWCRQMIATLRSRWPEASEELPRYPAFATRQ